MKNKTDAAHQTEIEMHNMMRNIKKFRLERGCTITQVCEATHIPRDILESLENGILTQEFDIDSFCRLCRFYHKSTSDFLNS